LKPGLSYALSGGEDYELLFTVPPRCLAKLGSLKLTATEIGVITDRGSVSVIGEDGKRVRWGRKGYEHFAGTAGPRGRR
jgi:thiamine-monophosphate kinase